MRLRHVQQSSNNGIAWFLMWFTILFSQWELIDTLYMWELNWEQSQILTWNENLVMKTDSNLYWILYLELVQIYLENWRGSLIELKIQFLESMYQLLALVVVLLPWGSYSSHVAIIILPLLFYSFHVGAILLTWYLFFSFFSMMK